MAEQPEFILATPIGTFHVGWASFPAPAHEDPFEVRSIHTVGSGAVADIYAPEWAGVLALCTERCRDLHWRRDEYYARELARQGLA